MKKVRVEQYEGLTLCNIETDELIEDFENKVTHIRIKTPAKENFQIYYGEKGFFHADRMLKATINLRKVSSDLERKIRLNVIKTDNYKNEILQIALKSFPIDRRFNVDKYCNSQTASKIIGAWVEEIKEAYVCIFRDKVVGFAVLEEMAEGIYEIRLAAVDENYRMSGAAVSLYTAIVQECVKREGKKLFGWISSVNMAVMNLYISLGATFSEPSDIFLREL